MNDYEVVIETINPCGGASHAKREIIEISAASPEEYVRSNGRFPIIDRSETADGVCIVTGDGAGNVVRYIFSE